MRYRDRYRGGDGRYRTDEHGDHAFPEQSSRRRASTSRSNTGATKLIAPENRSAHVADEEKVVLYIEDNPSNTVLMTMIIKQMTGPSKLST
jgi:hypothetical protein